LLAAISSADLPGGLQFLHAIARHNQHVPILGQIGFVAQRAMPRNDLGVVVGQGQNFVRGDNLPSIFPPVLASMTG